MVLAHLHKIKLKGETERIPLLSGRIVADNICVFIYLLSKPGGVLALKWGKSSEGEAFCCEGLEVLCVEGDSLLVWSTLIRCSSFH